MFKLLFDNMEWLFSGIALVLITFTIKLFRIIKKEIQKRLIRNIVGNKILSFNEKQVKLAKKYFIPLKFQSIDPSILEEPTSNIAEAQELIIPKFTNEYFCDEGENKYYIILADTGMGKSTLLINMFLNYYYKINNKFDILLMPLEGLNIKDELNKVKNKGRTILLLDGLDENVEAQHNFDARFSELIDLTKNFYKVVITCRTQFFPDEKSEPYDTKILSTNKKTFKFRKLYLSPFSDEDVKAYLKKRFGIFNRNKYNRALELVENCKYLSVRPMLLAYINDFVDKDIDFSSRGDVYKKLISNWIEREDLDVEEMYKFIDSLSLYFYENNKLYINNIDVSSFLKEYSINLDVITAKSRSLLNRDSFGRYKFSHKSIYEYLIYKQAYHNVKFSEEVNMQHLRNSFDFLEEEISILRKNSNSELSEVEINALYTYTRLKFEINYTLPFERIEAYKSLLKEINNNDHSLTSNARTFVKITYSIAKIYLELNDYTSAEQYAIKAFNVATKHNIGDFIEYSRMQLLFIKVLQGDINYDEPIGSNIENNENGSSVFFIDYLLNLVRINRRLGNYLTAYRKLSQLEELSKNRIISQYNSIMYEKGSLLISLDIYNPAIKTFKSIQVDLNEAARTNDLIHAKAFMRIFDGWDQDKKENSKKYNDLLDSIDSILSYNKIELSYFYLQFLINKIILNNVIDITESEKHLKEAKDLYKQLIPNTYYSLELKRLEGNLKRIKGETGEAITIYTEIIELCKVNSNSYFYTLINSIHDLSYVYRDLADYKLAVQYVEEAIDLLKNSRVKNNIFLLALFKEKIKYFEILKLDCNDLFAEYLNANEQIYGGFSLSITYLNWIDLVYYFAFKHQNDIVNEILQKLTSEDINCDDQKRAFTSYYTLCKFLYDKKLLFGTEDLMNYLLKLYENCDEETKHDYISINDLKNSANPISDQAIKEIFGYIQDTKNGLK